ncbi:Uma2 family endonuclease [Crocosphaera sp. XPORK-15E]|uniref:Uma2 family endonuclease n=1 Tax=Crocosphaera sp. XPORK-15E TaxID=3110247 RepID=UPI002B1FFAC8|nr:Uma2 family endonuclease [Crocosphaera sp. XPORK-15E]MEA5536475.1 Uma2 family endonuclease [Crocosphaera sp. XPORK-15E]
MTKTLLKTETRILLTGVRWETYQGLALDLAENPSKKLTYDQGILEIMTPLPEHEINKGFLGRLVQTTTEVLGLEILSLCSTTLSREDLRKGIEPDECYYITNEVLIRGKINFDFNVDPAPDLAIEIDITSSSLNRLSIYEALGIGEIWRFDGQELFIYCLKEGGYEEQEFSKVLPILSKSLILRFLKRRGEMGENALVNEFRQWLRNNS